MPKNLKTQAVIIAAMFTVRERKKDTTFGAFKKKVKPIFRGDKKEESPRFDARENKNTRK